MTSERVDAGNMWAQKTVTQLWDFASQMWEHRNGKLHDPKSEMTRKMKAAAVDLEISRLYGMIDKFAEEDRWHFNIPLKM